MTTSAAATLSGAAPAAPAAPAPSAAPAAPAPAAAAPAPIAAAPAAAAPAANGEWYATLDATTQGYIQNKGWKDPSEVVNGYMNLEKLRGVPAERLLTMPGENATPEEIKAFNTKLGVPEKVDGYQLPIPQGQDGALAKTAAAWFHEAGVPAKAAAKVVEAWNAHVATAQAAENEQFQQRASVEHGEVIAEWGAAADKMTELGKRAATQFVPAKSNEERVQILAKIEHAIGTGAMLRMFATIGQGLGEHAVHQSDAQGGFDVLTPGQASAKIEQLKADKEWSAAYLGGDKNKLAEMERLQKLAAGVRP